jgi:hypothetical protein
MLAKKFALAFGIAVVFPAMIHSGVSILSPPPKWPDYVAADYALSEVKEKQAAHRAATEVFQRQLLTVAVPLGLIALAAGAFLLSPAMGAGLMFGGIFSVCDGYFNYWSELSHTWKFLSLLAAFVVLLAVGFWKLERKEI